MLWSEIIHSHISPHLFLSPVHWQVLHLFLNISYAYMYKNKPNCYGVNTSTNITTQIKQPS